MINVEESVVVNLADDNDRIDVRGTIAETTINAGPGNDVVTVYESNHQVTVNADGDADQLIIDRSEAITSLVGTVDVGMVSGFGLSEVRFDDDGLEDLIVKLGSGDDTVNLKNTSATTATVVNGNGGDDRARIDAVGGETSFNGGDGRDVAELVVDETFDQIGTSFPRDDNEVFSLGFGVEALIVNASDNANNPSWALIERAVVASFTEGDIKVTDAIGADTVKFLGSGTDASLSVVDSLAVLKTIRVDGKTVEIEQGLDVLESNAAGQALSSEYLPGASLKAPYDIAFDSERKHAYVLDNEAIRIFEVDSDSPGKFYFLGSYDSPEFPVSGSGELAVAPDGETLYAVNTTVGRLIKLDRNPSTGELSGLATYPILLEAQSVYVSPDSTYVYIMHGGVGSGYISWFQNDGSGNLVPLPAVNSRALSNNDRSWRFKDWAFDPDGTRAYISGTRERNNDTVSRIARVKIDPANGRLLFEDNVVNVETSRELYRDGILAFGPDGSLYSADRNQMKLYRFFRDVEKDYIVGAWTPADIPGDDFDERNSELVIRGNRVYLTVDAGNSSAERRLITMPIPGFDGEPMELPLGTAGSGRIELIPGTDVLAVPQRTDGNLDLVDLDTTSGDAEKIKTISTGTTDERPIPSLNTLAIAPSGLSVYGLSSEGNSLIKFSVDEANGELTEQYATWGSAFSVDGLGGATDLIVQNASAGGNLVQDVYVASPDEGKVTVFRDSGTDLAATTSVDVAGARFVGFQPEKLLSRPAQLYVGGSDSVVAFEENRRAGTFGNATSFSTGAPIVDLVLDDTSPLSSEIETVYAATANTIRILRKNSSGDLQQLQEFSYFEGAISKLLLVGSRLYVGTTNGAISVLPVNGNGTLGAAIQTVRNGQQGIVGIPTIDALVQSRNSQFVFAGSGAGQAILTFLRENDGTLTPVERSTQGSSGFDGLAGVNDLQLHPTSGRIYASNRNTGGVGESGGWAVFDVLTPSSLEIQQYQVEYDDTFNDLNVTSGDGDDFVSILSSDARITTVDTRGGGDQVVLWTTAMGAETDIDLGDGNDLLRVDGDRLLSDVTASGEGHPSGDTLEFLGDPNALEGTFNSDGTLRMTPTGSEDLFVKVTGNAQLNYDTFEFSSLQIDAGFDVDDIQLEEGGSAVLADPIPSSLVYNSVSWDLDGDGFFFDVTTPGLDLPWPALQSFGIDDDGSYPIAIQVITPNLQIIETTSIVVTNKSPTLTASLLPPASSGDPWVVEQGVPVQIQLESEGDPGDDTLFEWTVNWGDGTVMTYSSDNPVVEHVYEEVSASRTISITAKDEDGEYGPITQTIKVEAEEDPRMRQVVGSTVGNIEVYEGDLIDLFFTQSGGITTAEQWSVNYGDRIVTPFTDVTDLPHRYSDDGEYVVSALVLESDGSYLPTTADLLVTVNNVPPTLVVEGADVGDEGSPYTLDLSSTDPGDDQITKWTIDWGDGKTSEIDGSLDQATHIYADDSAGEINGQYVISISAEDEDGTYSAADRTVTINNVAAANIDGPSFVDENSSYQLTLSNQDPGDDTTIQWVIDWGDGAIETVTGDPGPELIVTHVFQNGPVSRTITAAMTDEDGPQTDTINVSVLNVDPVPVISGARFASEGSPYLLTLDAIAPEDTPIVRWEVDWGDSTGVEDVVPEPGETSLSLIHRFADGPNTATVMATAYDADDIGYTTELVVETSNRPPTVRLFGDVAVEEGSFYELHLGAIVDPGQDIVTQYTIDWGDGVTETLSDAEVSSLHGVIPHFYRDNPPSDPTGSFYISVDLEDEDGVYPNAGSTSVRALNVAPVGDAGGPYQILLPHTTIAMQGSATDPGVLDTLTLEWDFDGDGLFGESGADAENGDERGPNAVFDTAGAVPGTLFDIALRVTDDDGGVSKVVSTTVRYLSIPEIDSITLATDTIDENDVAELTIDFTDVDPSQTHTITVDWGDDSVPTVVTLPIGDRSVTLNHPYLDDNPTGTVSDVYTIDVTVANSAADDTGATSITVDNVVPEVLDFTSDASALETKSDDTKVTISGLVGDIGSLDTHTAVVNWGDGSDPETIDVDAYTRAFAGLHDYPNPGLYEITVTVTDDDGGVSETVSTAAYIQGVGVVDGTLFIIGTEGRDHVKLTHREAADRLDVDAKFNQGAGQTRSRDSYTAADIQRIVTLVCSGDDHVNFAPLNGFTGEIIVRGGRGEDTIIGGEANSILLGEDGDDHILGGSGRDIVIGGLGADKTHGNNGDDILVAGTTSHDNEDSALLAILAEWGSANTYERRVGNISGENPVEDRLNGDFYLTKVGAEPTVFEDDQRDSLHGGGGRDWVFYDPALDRFQGRKDEAEGEVPRSSFVDPAIYDVNGDGYASAIDALLVIRDLNRDLQETRSDVNGDGYATPRDALLVIRYLNSDNRVATSLLARGEVREDRSEANHLNNQDEIWRHWLWLDDDDWPWASSR